MGNALKTEQVIDRFKNAHGDRYDYSQVQYINSKRKIKIICKEHGVFEQTPEKHQYQGCSKCVNKNITNEEFIQKSKITHGKKYDYSLVEYKNSLTFVEIKCDIHGIFKQTPKNHLKYGCTKCGSKRVSDKLKLTLDEFVNRAKNIHKDNYDYSLVDYKNSSVKIKIICLKHGVFKQSPNSHLRGEGCSKCGDDRVSAKLKSNTINFIHSSNIVHDNTFDYSRVQYKNNKSKVNIICSIHGEFKQTPNSHLRGNGCPICKSSKGENKIYKIINSNCIEFGREHKFSECKNIQSLPFDFYLTKYNTCIEFHGRQHFEINDFFGGEKEFLENKKRDNIKEKYCKNNNISLIIIFKLDNNMYNFIDLYNNSPSEIKKILLDNQIIKIEKKQYNEFKNSFNIK